MSVLATVPDERRALIAAAVEEARTEADRADGKAGTLLALATAALAGLVTFAHARIPVAASVLLWLAAGSAGAAVYVLLAAIRPRLGGSARMLEDHARLLADGTDLAEWQVSRLRMLSAIAAAKHRRIRHSADLLVTGLMLLAAAVPLVITGGA
jgi:hypothetical protein